jgi:hypothetical protein
MKENHVKFPIGPQFSDEEIDTTNDFILPEDIPDE